MFWLVVWGAAIYVAARIGATKGRLGLGIVLGVLLSWVGVIIMVFLDRKETHA